MSWAPEPATTLMITHRLILSTLCAAAMLGVRTDCAAQADALPFNERLNGLDTVKAFSAASTAMRESVLTLHDPGQRDPFAMATLVAPGIAITKASEIEGKPALEARDDRRRPHPVEVVRIDKTSDLAVLKVDWPDGKPVHWAEKSPELGRWVIATTPRIGMVRVGLNAASQRPIGTRGATLGVVLQDAPKKQTGCLVAELIPDAAAAKAGIQKGDVIIKANDKAIAKRDDLGEFLKAQDPGATVKFELKRKGKVVKVEVKLDSPSDMLDKMNRNQQMSGRTSRRKDPFPMILHTDIPLPPEAMGSPLVDIHGHAVGILIARADRVTTYALPKDFVVAVIDGKPAPEVPAPAAKPADKAAKPTGEEEVPN